MSEDQKKVLERELWNIANTLRGKMDADEFRDYILGFIFYKYLSERMHLYANDILAEDGIKYEDIKEDTAVNVNLLQLTRRYFDFHSSNQISQIQRGWELDRGFQ